jgi:hypothetical protein
MPEPSWEKSTNAWAYGYLKFLDFQTDGYDVHATMMKNSTVHVSVYVVGTTTNAKLEQKPMKYGPSGYVLEDSNRLSVKNIVSPSSEIKAEYWTWFQEQVNKKAQELGMVSAQGSALQTQPVPTMTPTVAKGGSSGLPQGATWGDAHKQQQYNKQFPSLAKSTTS